MNERTAIVMHVLHIMAQAAEPLGSGTISQELQTYDCAISEATVGRILREMDLDGLTEKLGYRGRVLTEEGHTHLKKLQDEEQRQFYGHELIQLIEVNNQEEMLNMLYARTAVEQMTVRLATQNATDEELHQLQQTLRPKQGDEGSAGLVEQDVQFHKIIATASRNPILEAILNLLRRDGQQSAIIQYIRKQVGIGGVNDHQQICEAIISRNPDQAEQAMRKHMEHLIEDVRKYWKVVHMKQKRSRG